MPSSHGPSPPAPVIVQPGGVSSSGDDRAKHARINHDPARPATNDDLLQAIQDQTKLAVSSYNDDHLQFQDPSKLLENVDPPMRKLFHEWSNETKNLFQALSSQMDLKNKYDEIIRANKLAKQFQHTADEKWQWLKIYVNNCRPIQGLAQDNTMIAEMTEAGDNDFQTYSVEKAFRAMKLRHALEAQKFVFEHQSAALELLRDRCKPEKLMKNYKIKWMSLFRQTLCTTHHPRKR